MTAIPDNTATSWRDLADELTDHDRASIEKIERETGGRMPGVLLDYARRSVEDRLIDMAYCDLAAPGDARWVGLWEKHIQLGWSRSLVWREWGPVSDADLYVAIDGRQQCDGTVVRGISPYVDDASHLTSAQARRLAALLIEAADELDRLS